MGTSRAVVFVSVSIFVGISTHLAYNIKRTMIDGVEPVQLKIDRGYEPSKTRKSDDKEEE